MLVPVLETSAPGGLCGRGLVAGTGTAGMGSIEAETTNSGGGTGPLEGQVLPGLSSQRQSLC